MIDNSTSLCALCNQSSKLEESHIIPSFVFRWLKQTGGPLRNTLKVNRRVQDGIKTKLLCRICEQKFSVLEKYFSEEVFLPYVNNPRNVHFYDERMLQFCVSVSWRTLVFYKCKSVQSDFTPAHQKSINLALSQWGQYLRLETPHLGEFKQHILPLDVISGVKGAPHAPSINRYLLRSSGIDLLIGDNSILTYSKLGPIALIGHVSGNFNWRNTEVPLKKGSIKPITYGVPSSVLQYMFSEANNIFQIFSGISNKQSDLIQKEIMKDPEKYINSKSFKAIEADIKIFGDAAFFNKSKTQ